MMSSKEIKGIQAFDLCVLFFTYIIDVLLIKKRDLQSKNIPVVKKCTWFTVSVDKTVFGAVSPNFSRIEKKDLDT